VHGRRACFFGADRLSGEGLRGLLVGLQPFFVSSRWLAALAGRRRLREQLRRARAKGVRVRRVTPAELAPSSRLRRDVEALAQAWLASRPIEPMGFVVTVEPFHRPEEHRYYVAEQEGRAVGFLSAVPIGAENAWLAEDVFRAEGAPNGTTESLIRALLEDSAASDYVTLGPTPLAGPVAWPLRLSRWAARPLFDFAGLHAFRQRLRPDGWTAVRLVFPASQGAAVTLVDVLRAFARGSLLRFAARSLVRHPSGLPWALAMPLPAWTAALAAVAIAGRATWLGFSRSELWLWVVFDVLLLCVLSHAALKPRRSRLAAVTLLAAFDAALSVAHVAHAGLGAGALPIALRALSTGAPLVGTALLAVATLTASRGLRRARPRLAATP
jgi:phosphatidylglycerol lysyltransferase